MGKILAVEIIMKDLTKGNIYKTFILFAIPLVLSGFLSQAYHIIDTMIAGKFLGSDGIAAIGATSSAIQFISSLFWGFATGTSVYLAVLFGGKDYENLKSALISNFLLYTGAIIAFSMILIILRDTVFDFLKIDPAIREETAIYFVIYLSGLFLILLNHFGICVLNSFGISGYAFAMSLVSTVLNIGGNLISVTVLDAGVGGIATSSVLSALVVNVCYYFKIKKCLLQMNTENVSAIFSPAAIRRTFSFSLPVMLQQSVMYIASLLISPVVNGIGSSATAAYAVVHRVYEINANVYQNSSKTLTTYTAQCVGGKKYHLIKKGVGVAFVQGTLFVLPLILICVLFSKEISGAFFPDGYVGDGLKFSIDFSRYFLPFILFNVINNLFHSFYRGVKCMKLLVISTLAGSVVRIAASYALSFYFGIYGVYGGWIVSWIAEAVFCIVTYFAGTWKKEAFDRL